LRDDAIGVTFFSEATKVSDERAGVTRNALWGGDREGSPARLEGTVMHAK
jgi:hypothetical protein